MTLINDGLGLISVLLFIPAILFVMEGKKRFEKLFKYVPALVFAYFIPTLLTLFGIIPPNAPIYSPIKSILIPASLLLLTLAVDIKGIFKLGRKAVYLFLMGTFSVVIGGPISLWLWEAYLPADAWQGMAALAGSWIGGGANFIAVGEVAGASESMMGSMVIVDVFIANIWTGILMYMAGKYQEVDAYFKADNSAIEELKHTVTEFQKKTARVSTTTDFMVMMAMAFGFSWISIELSKILPPIGTFITQGTWKVLLITTFAVGLSYTKARKYEGAGASKLGTVFLYMLIGVIGASADFKEIVNEPYLILMGATWIIIHITLMFITMRWLNAPLFFMAVGSKANIGGAASAPIVASAFHPSLATVGVMEGIGGYVLGTYAALLCMQLLMLV
jgi:uncharacterized membrane protein